MNNASDGIFGHRRVMLEFHGADPRSAHNADETHERPGHRSIVSGHGAVYGRADALNRGKSLVVFRIVGRKPGTQLPCRFHICRNFNGFFVTV